MSGGGERYGDDNRPPPITGSDSVELSAPAVRGEGTVGPPVPVEAKPFDPEPRRETMRAAFAMLFVLAFLALTGSLVVGVARGWWDIATAKDLAAFALTPLAGLTGTAVGFYYAGRKS